MPLAVRWCWLTLALLALIWLGIGPLRGLVVLVAVAVLLATGVRPIVAALERVGLPHRFAVPVTLVGLAVIAVAGAMAVAPLLVRQVAALAAMLPRAATEVSQWGARWQAMSEQTAYVPSLADLTEWLTTTARNALHGALGWTNRFAALLGDATLVVLMTTYLVADGGTLCEQGLLLVPPYRRGEVRHFLSRLADRLGHFVLGTAIDMSIVGLLTALGLSLVGVPDALALGLIIGVFNLVPFVGATIGSIPALIIAFGISMRVGVLALAMIALVQQLEGNLIYPRVVGSAVGLHPLYVLLALTAGTTLLGVPGVFLGIPAVLVAKTVLELWIVPRTQRVSPRSIDKTVSG